MNLFGTTDVAIDIGPETSHVLVKGRGIVFSGRTDELCASSGAGTLPELISECLGRAGIRRGVFRPKIRVVMAIDHCNADVEKRRFEEAATLAGSNGTWLFEIPMAAAIGAGVPVSEPRGSMIVEMRGGGCQIAVISLAGIAAARDVSGCATASSAKGEEPKVERVDQVPKEMVADAMKDVLAECAAKGLRNIVSDILDRGAVMTGGDGVDEGLAKWLAENVGFPVRVAHNPVTAAVEGAGVVLNELDVLRSPS